jgi:hypothetical protein
MRWFLFCFMYMGWLAAGAQHRYYVPMSIHQPALSNQYDGSIGVGVANGIDFEALELQAVFSPFKKLAIMGNYLNKGDEKVRNRTATGFDLDTWELALGTYFTYNQANKRVFGSIFGGYGSGKVLNTYLARKTSQLEFSRIFIQPGLFWDGRYLFTKIALKFYYLQFNKGNVDFGIESEDLTIIQTIEKSTPSLSNEMLLSIGVRMGAVQLAGNMTTINPKIEGLNFSRVNFSLGLSFDIGEWRLKKKK